MPSSDEIRSLLNLSEDELLLELGAAAGTGSLPSDIRALGERIFNRCCDEFLPRICADKRLRYLCTDANAVDAVVTWAALFDLVTGMSFSFSPATFCTLAVKRGLPKLC